MDTPRRRIAAALLAAAPLGAAAVASADDEITIDLAGIVIEDGATVTRDSAPMMIDAAIRYGYEIDALVRGRGLGLGSLYPDPTPLGDVLDDFQPGASDLLVGEVDNPAGTLPFDVIDEEFMGEGDIIGITARFEARIVAGIRADGVGFFSFEDIVISPAILIGSLEVVSGTATIRVVDVPCRADFDGDGELTIFDFLAFQNAFAMGDPAADFDGDGSLTIFDFLAFQNEFAIGCP
ncbi:MAG: GC-type dockerin domain-anchored protein [Planctomycetota bacterium]